MSTLTGTMSATTTGHPSATVIPPGTGPSRDYNGPWFSTQLTLSLGLGVFSLLLFSFLRTRWKRVYMAKAYVDPESVPNMDMSFFGWVMPTWRTSDFMVLQTVGLDAAVFLDFLKTSCKFFAFCAVAAILVLMPINFSKTGKVDSDPNTPPPDDPSNSTSTATLYLPTPTLFADPPPPTTTALPAPTIIEWILDPGTTTWLHLFFTYFFSLLALYLLNASFLRFLRARQYTALNASKSVPSRTVLVSNLPRHLRSEEGLREYFEEECGWAVERVSVVRIVGRGLKAAIQRRAETMYKLESVSWEYSGGGNEVNVVEVESPPSEEEGRPPLPSNGSSGTTQSVSRKSSHLTDHDEFQTHWNDVPVVRARSPIALPSSSDLSGPRRSSTDSRPTMYVPNSFMSRLIHRLGEEVDAIDHWTAEFQKADRKVRELRVRDGKKPVVGTSGDRDPDEETGLIQRNQGGDEEQPKERLLKPNAEAFVTFKTMRDAQLAAQTVHYPEPSQCITSLAPDPKDIIWENMGMPRKERAVRDLGVKGLTLLGMLFWNTPVVLLASLLSYEEIKKVAPWLAHLIDVNPVVGALIQNTLPSSGIIIFNAALPFLLEYMCWWQGFRSKAQLENSVLKKYTLFLLLSVVFLFLLVSSFWQIVRDWAGSPESIPTKLAEALMKSNAKAFSISYVMLAGIGLMPFQLLNFGTVFVIGIWRPWARTPQDFAALYAPSAINYGMTYPPAILIFILTLMYSVLSPLILIFGCIYFALSYIVFKYKLLNVHHNPATSNGEAWPTTFVRLTWGIILFQVFMTGLFLLRGKGGIIPGLLMLPLLSGTTFISWYMHTDLEPLSEFAPISLLSHLEGEVDVERMPHLRMMGNAGDGDGAAAKRKKEATTAAYIQPDLSSKLRRPWLPSE